MAVAVRAPAASIENQDRGPSEWPRSNATLGAVGIAHDNGRNRCADRQRNHLRRIGGHVICLRAYAESRKQHCSDR
jgi:hypothetical protein